MPKHHPPEESRRHFLRTVVATPFVLSVPLVVGLANFGKQPDPAVSLVPTLACEDDDEDDPTVSQTEGPFFSPNSPKRTSLIEPAVQGTRLVVTGWVLTRSCRPVANALLDFWQADDNGRYDNVGYRLRGHQFTDAQGAFRLETIVPGLYPGRTRHIHVKVQAPHQPILTTQLYFPEERRNARDGIFRPELLMNVTGSETGREGRFNFVLDLP